MFSYLPLFDYRGLAFYNLSDSELESEVIRSCKSAKTSQDTKTCYTYFPFSRRRFFVSLSLFPSRSPSLTLSQKSLDFNVFENNLLQIAKAFFDSTRCSFVGLGLDMSLPLQSWVCTNPSRNLKNLKNLKLGMKCETVSPHTLRAIDFSDCSDLAKKRTKLSTRGRQRGRGG